MTKVLVLVFALCLVAGCTGTEPSGPTVNNTGDNNAFNFSDESNGPSTAQTPAPVVVQPVVLAPEGEE